MTAVRPDTVASSHLASYLPDGQRYDELLDDDGSIRAHWQPLLAAAAGTDPRTTVRRALDITRRLVVENGVTYNVYADPKGADRPWALDPLPLVLPAAEWRTIDRGLVQRAALLDALLADLYGPQRLLAEGIVPAALPFGHPNFLWPAHGVVPRGGQWLPVYAADLARAPDGRWWVLSDRTQTPSGAGYALENREIVEQVWPDVIAEMGVRRIGNVFGELRERLLGLTDDGESPLAVVLTPGHFNETYFEHAYLARHLGFVLAEGSDLTVRNDTLYLKTLAGLRRVHTILRRLDDDYADPVELKSDSALGVAGLMGAVRAGRVVLANALGSGVLESAAWLGFLPRVAERLLGESLVLPSVATWWCGEVPALEYVIDNLERLVIKPTYPNQRFEPVFGSRLDATNRAAMIDRLRARPYAYVAQEHLALSQAPVWRPEDANQLAAKAVSLRVYAIAGPDTRHVLPGGLARVAGDSAAEVVSTQRGGGSKDVWVLNEPAEASARISTATPARAASRHDEIPSRLVENLYWFGRYLVRCEDKARLLRATLAARVDYIAWQTAVATGRSLGVIALGQTPTASVRDDENPYGLIADVRRLTWCASQVRGRLSTSCWSAVADMQSRLNEALSSREDPRAVLDRLLLSLAALAGFALDAMTQDAGWRFLRVGRRLERLQFVCSVLGSLVASDAALSQAPAEWMLEAYESLRVYRSRYVCAPRLGPLLDLIVRDSEHPRAITYLMNSMAKDLKAVVALSGTAGEEPMDLHRLDLTDEDLAVLELEDVHGAAARQALVGRLRGLANSAADLSDRLSMRYFAHISLDAQALAT